MDTAFFKCVPSAHHRSESFSFWESFTHLSTFFGSSFSLLSTVTCSAIFCRLIMIIFFRVDEIEMVMTDLERANQVTHSVAFKTMSSSKKK